MLEEILIFAIKWVPTFIWIILCFYGISLGFKEMREAKGDLKIVDDLSDPRMDVAEGTYKTALKNTAVQFVFLLLVIVVTFSKITDPTALAEPVGFIRSFITPGIMIFAESMLVSQLRGIDKTRAKVRHKARNFYQLGIEEAENKRKAAESQRECSENLRIEAEDKRQRAERNRTQSHRD